MSAEWWDLTSDEMEALWRSCDESGVPVYIDDVEVASFAADVLRPRDEQTSRGAP